MLRKPSYVKAPGWISSTRLCSRCSSFRDERPSKASCIGQVRGRAAEGRRERLDVLTVRQKFKTNKMS